MLSCRAALDPVVRGRSRPRSAESVEGFNELLAMPAEAEDTDDHAIETRMILLIAALDATERMINPIVERHVIPHPENHDLPQLACLRFIQYEPIVAVPISVTTGVDDRNHSGPETMAPQLEQCLKPVDLPGRGVPSRIT